MSATTHRRARRLAWIVALVALAVGAAFVRLVDERRSDAKRRAAGDAATALARRLEQELNASVSAAQVVAGVLKQTGRVDRLDALAAELRRDHPGIETLALAPGGVVARAEPPQAGEDRIDREALRDRAAEAAAAGPRGSKAFVLAGETRRVGGKSVLPILLPVFLPGPGEPERFWGFVVVAVDPREMLRSAGAESLVADGFDYELTATAPTGRRSIVLARSDERGLREPIAAGIAAPASSWALAVAPRGGWRSPSTVAAGIVLVLVAALLAALSAHRLAREPDTLLEEVEVRRRRLSEANRQLHAEVSQRLEAEERLRHDAAHDALTSLPNRTSFLSQVQAALDFTQGRELKTAVLLLDMDRFKYVNDSLGHTVGDRLLVEVAARLQACLRPGDALARVGGDEFAILLCDDPGAGTPQSVADRLLKEMKLPFGLGDDEAFSTMSIGIAVSTPACARAEDLLRDADTAMHRAKAQGRARHVSFDEGMRTRVVALLQLETDLRRAIEREEFRVHYQPIVSLASGSITGFEALVRWQHPARGFVQPMEFMPLAEETGLVVWIDRWVLAEASRLVRAWQQRFPRDDPFFVSVNFSGKQLSQPRLVEHVARTLRDAGLDVSSLKLEITESVVMENAEAAVEILRGLREMGVRLSIDDFGTGYSSLGYLARFPFHTVKIDQSFVRGSHQRGKETEIVRTIVELAHTLGMDVIAEGVETVEQLRQLRAVACGFGQGYLFSRPQSAADMERLIESGPRW